MSITHRRSATYKLEKGLRNALTLCLFSNKITELFLIHKIVFNKNILIGTLQIELFQNFTSMAQALQNLKGLALGIK